MKTFAEVVGEALEETREKCKRYWQKDFTAPENRFTETMDAVNFALGLFSGIVVRRMKGDPDPDIGTITVERPQPSGLEDTNPLGRKSKSSSSKKEKVNRDL